MAQVRLPGLALQTTAIDPFTGERAIAKPHHHRHMGLRLRRQRIRRRVQVQPVLAQRFAVIGDVNHRRVQ
ncbi:hypothetical protein D3C81_1731760 [compost metagenome]